MTKTTHIFSRVLLGLSLVALMTSCQKMKKPDYADYPADANPPGGPLKFYAAFDGTTADPLMNGVDSIRANFPASNPLTSVAGVAGKAIQGADGKAVLYPSANDFKDATSFSISIWLKNTAQAGRTEFLFSLQDDTYGWHHSAIFLLMENQTSTSATMKLCVMDQWLEGQFNKPVFDGNWHHIVYSYDQTTSKMTYYFDGAVVTGMNATQTDVKSGGSPRGAVNFKQANKFILAGFNKHVNSDGPTDDWIKSYNGAMDQVRLYGKALSATEVSALYNSRL